ncbi:hypothetical protein OROHE_000220 [Orobanche hederae]
MPQNRNRADEPSRRGRSFVCTSRCKGAGYWWGMQGLHYLL